MPPGPAGSPIDGAFPIYDIPPRPTATAVQGSGTLLDLAPSGGADVVVIGLVAAVIASVLVLIVRSRRR